MLSNGTIIALSTPQGQGAIGLIRISGPEAISKTKLFFQAKSKITVDEAPYMQNLNRLQLAIFLNTGNKTRKEE